MLTTIYVNSAAFLHTLKKDQRGVTAIEYAVVAVAIAGLVATIFSANASQDQSTLAGALTDAFQKVAETIAAVSKQGANLPSD